MKNFLKITLASICITVLVGALSGCNTKAAAIEMSDVQMFALGVGQSNTALTEIGANRAERTKDAIRVTLAPHATDVRIDLTKFFNHNKNFLGKNFYFTRDDVKKGDGTFVRGSAWVQVDGEAGNRLYKKLGFENNPNIAPQTRQEIEQLDAFAGAARIYFHNDGTQILYLEPSTSGELQSGQTNVTFRFHGQHGRVARLNIIIDKA